MIRWSLALVTISFYTLSSAAYILRPQTILQKMIRNNGVGIYQIEQELVFSSSDSDSLVIKETWQVKDQDTIKLVAIGTRAQKETFRFSTLYSGGQKIFLDAAGNKQNQAMPSDFFERYFFFRKSQALATQLIRDQIVRPEFFRVGISKSGNEFIYPRDPQLNLGRVGGGVTYFFGTPTPPDSTEAMPGLWVEQDQFFIRKLRFKSQAEMVVEKASNYGRGFIFPKNRTLRWGVISVSINTLNVLGLSEKQAVFTSTSLQPNQIPSATSDDSPWKLVSEFYTRFR
jgi:hypothetical protein